MLDNKKLVDVFSLIGSLGIYVESYSLEDNILYLSDTDGLTTSTELCGDGAEIRDIILKLQTSLKELNLFKDVIVK